MQMDFIDDYLSAFSMPSGKVRPDLSSLFLSRSLRQAAIRQLMSKSYFYIRGLIPICMGKTVATEDVLLKVDGTDDLQT